MEKQEAFLDYQDSQKPVHQLLKEPEDIDAMEKRLMKQMDETMPWDTKNRSFFNPVATICLGDIVVLAIVVYVYVSVRVWLNPDRQSKEEDKTNA